MRVIKGPDAPVATLSHNLPRWSLENLPQLALEILRAKEQKMEMHRGYSEHYGYVFYII
jgi:hypothetical protein